MVSIETTRGAGGELGARGLAAIRGERLVFQDLSFRAAPGDLLVVTGPNGSGKSTLLRLLAGLLAPARGEVSYAGRVVLGTGTRPDDAYRSRLHYLGHDNALKPALTVIENLRFWAGFYGGRTDRAALLDALRRFEVDRLADLPVRVLSAGQRRRVALSRLTAVRRSLWILDEPDAALDSYAGDLLAAVMVKQFQDRQLRVGEDVIAYLLARIERSFAAVAAVVSAIDAAALERGRAVTVPLAREVIGNSEA